MLPRVVVRGGARIDVRAARSAGRLVLSGIVTDDMGAPVGGGSVVLTVTRESSGPSTDVPLSATSAEVCETSNGEAAFGGTGGVVLPTDARARFCVRLDLPRDPYVAHLEVGSSAFLDGARVNLPLDVAREAVTLRFDPEPSILDLDGDVTSVDVVATTQDDAEISAAGGLLLRLSNEADVTLASATTAVSGDARFRFASAGLGPAGRGEIRVSFMGNADDGASTHSAPVERRTRVGLEASRAPDTAASLGLGPMTVEVVATAACEAGGCASSPTGSVELYLGETLVGAAALAKGRAGVVARSAGRRDFAFRVHYVADAPWFVPAGDLVLRLPPAPTNLGAGILVALAGLAAAGWVVASRWPRRDLAAGAGPPKPPAGRPRAGLKVLRAFATSPELIGRVIDAHDIVPIAGARIRLERPGFQTIEVISEATSGPDGHIELALAGSHPGDDLVVESRQHCALRRPRPAHGEIEVAMVLRRRELLESLVRWARRRGGRFDARPEPTPGHVRRMAGDEPKVAAWADALERAAYGSEIVDERIELEVNRLAPGTGRGKGTVSH